ncbi:MAG: hypothetical protein M1823_008899, partial [Watsoniomyces obsoletus]
MSRLGDKAQLPPLQELGVGFVAGAATKLVTTPIANVVTRAQARAMVELSKAEDHRPGPRALAREIMNEK